MNLSRFKRITSSSLFVPEIDGLRFVAIILVVLNHANGFIIAKNPEKFSLTPENYSIIYNFFQNGSKGVYLFFVISGYILAMPFARHFINGEKKVDLKKYFLRRIFRLEPPYIITMIAAFFLLVVFGGRDLGVLWQSLAASLVYLHNLLPVSESVNAVAWSLEIEIQFYILVPLLVYLFKIKTAIRRFIWPFLIIFFSAINTMWPVDKLTIYSFLHYFLLGFWLVDLSLSNVKKSVNYFLESSFVGSFLLIVSFAVIIYSDFSTLGGAMSMMVSMFVYYYYALNNSACRRFFSIEWLTAIGGMCYSIYLWHNIILGMLYNGWLDRWSQSSYIAATILELMIILPIILIFSGVFFLAIERPCMDREWPVKFKGFFRVKINYFSKILFKPQL